MKLKIGKKVYLQKYDVGRMVHFCSEFPEGILGEIFGGDDDIFLMNDNDRDMYDFCYVFRKPLHVEWLMKQEWLVDYCKYKSVPIGELLEVQDSLEGIRKEAVRKYNAEIEEYRSANADEVAEELNKIAHQMESIDILISFRKGATRFRFPEEIKEWEEYSENETNGEEEPKSSIKRFIEKILFFE